MENCKEARQLIYAEIDGALDAPGEKRLKDHLKSCVRCAAEYKEVLSLHLFYSNQMVVEPPEELTQRIMSQIVEQRVVPHESLLSPRWERIYLFAEAAAALVLLYLSAPLFLNLWSLTSYLSLSWHTYQINLSFITSLSVPDLIFLPSSLVARALQTMREFPRAFTASLQPYLLFIVPSVVVLQIIGNRVLFSSLKSS